MTIRLVAGVGINNADYSVFWREDGKGKHCQIYRRWHNMLNRAYNPEAARYPAMARGLHKVIVCKEWHTFSVFKQWFEDTHIEGYELDKDLKDPYAHEYSPETCLFIPHEVNVAITVNRTRGSDYMAGVIKLDYKTKPDRYRASAFGLLLGYYPTMEEANQVYRFAKADALVALAKKYVDNIDIKLGLAAHIHSLRNADETLNRYL